jgi:proteic killer suppression protein
LELILDHLNAAADITDMNYPGSGLHQLEPRTTDMEKQAWAVTVSGNWRVTFKYYGIENTAIVTAKATISDF